MNDSYNGSSLGESFNLDRTLGREEMRYMITPSKAFLKKKSTDDIEDHLRSLKHFRS